MELWTLKETGSKTRMSEAFWRKQVLNRAIPVIKIGRAVRLDADSVRAFLAARVRPACPQSMGGRAPEISRFPEMPGGARSKETANGQDKTH
jgi:hypothetical protein